MTSIQNKGFFLDLDGTLVNNLHVMFECYSNFMKRFELPYSQSEFDFYNGIHLEETLRQIKAKYNLTKENYRSLPLLSMNNSLSSGFNRIIRNLG